LLAFLDFLVHKSTTLTLLLYEMKTFFFFDYVQWAIKKIRLSYCFKKNVYMTFVKSASQKSFARKTDVRTFRPHIEIMKFCQNHWSLIIIGLSLNGTGPQPSYALY
jgi:hypothetical protein